MTPRTNFCLNQGGALLEARARQDGVDEDGAGHYRIRIIAPGRGSSGMYTTPNLAESAPLFVAGTHMYFDHPTFTEDWERPERSVRDLAGVFESGAQIMDDGSLEADIKVYPSANRIIKERWSDIGVSINAWTEDEIGPDGVVPVLAGVQSVDFVTKAGAKGAVLSVLESDGHWRQHRLAANTNTTNRESKEQPMKPEEITKAVSEAVAAALPAAIKEAAALLADNAKKAAETAKKEDPYEAAKAIAEASDLPDGAKTRVIEAVKRGVPSADAIETERAYIKAIRDAAATVKEAGAPDKPAQNVTVTSWAK